MYAAWHWDLLRAVGLYCLPVYWIIYHWKFCIGYLHCVVQAQVNYVRKYDLRWATVTVTDQLDPHSSVYNGIDPHSTNPLGLYPRTLLLEMLWWTTAQCSGVLVRCRISCVSGTNHATNISYYLVLRSTKYDAWLKVWRPVVGRQGRFHVLCPQAQRLQFSHILLNQVFCKGGS